MFVEKRPQKNTYFDQLAHVYRSRGHADPVIEEPRYRLRFKIETSHNLLDTFSNQLKESFKDFTTVVQKFKVLDQEFFQKSFTECEEAYIRVGR